MPIKRDNRKYKNPTNDKKERLFVITRKNSGALISIVLLLSTLSSNAESKKSKDPREVNSPSPSNATQLYLQTIGTVSAQSVYLTYLAIGTLTNSFASQAMDKESTMQILQEYISLSKACRDQLGTLAQEGKLTNEDKKVIRELETIYGLLIAEGQSFLDYIETGDNSYLSSFEENRKNALNRISKLLRIQE